MSHDDDLSTAVHPKTVQLALDRVTLSVVDGPDRGKSARVAIGSTRIGKAAGCHLLLSDPAVSRIHCEVRVGRSGVRITDRESTNGTFVDGVRVYEAELKHGSSLRIGATVVRVELEGGKAIVPLAPLDSFGPLIGASPEMRAIYAMIPAIGQSGTTALIQGETGTGKELVARAIHDASPRAQKPFVVLDCAGVSPGVIESDLFGHVRGAFTGAVAERQGLFEAARGGTIFIDEIIDLPASLQPRLLRVLEAREVRRVGGNQSIPVDVVVVAAASRPLAECVNAGFFRDDLFYRLAVAEIVLPPLRARGEDVIQLANHFWSRYAKPGTATPPELLSLARSRSWPGNVRELRNFVERIAKLGWAAAAPVGLRDEGRQVNVPVDLPLKEARRVWNERFEEMYASALLSQTGGNVTRAAELAGVNRRSFQRMLAKGDDGGDEADGDD